MSYSIGLLLSDFMLLKIYPMFLFVVFIFRLPDFFNLEASILDFLFIALIFAFLFSYLYSESNEALLQTTKNTINFIFFHQYVRLIPKNKLTSTSLLKPLCILILFSFLQLLYSVSQNGLWGYPLNIVNSASSEVINDLPKMIGVDPKNIWASQILFVFVIYSIAILYKKINLSLVSYGIVLMYALIQIYLASRVAQIASFMLILIVYFGLLFDAFELKINKFLLAPLLVFFVLLALTFFVLQMERVDFSKLYDFDNGHSGDGFKQRLIIYSFFYDYMHSISLFDFVFGVGVSGISSTQDWHFPESNLHNTFLTIFSDYGLFGLTMYVIYFLFFFKKYILKAGASYYFFLAPPVFVVMFQYQGFDLDILWFVASYASVSQMKQVKTVGERL